MITVLVIVIIINTFIMIMSVMFIIIIEDPIVMSIDNLNVVGNYYNYCPNLFSVLLRTFLNVALIVNSIYIYIYIYVILRNWSELFRP